MFSLKNSDYLTKVKTSFFHVLLPSFSSKTFACFLAMWREIQVGEGTLLISGAEECPFGLRLFIG